MSKQNKDNNSSNNFLKHFAIIGSGTMINMLLGLLTTPLITRIVSPDEYGQLSIFTMYGSIAVMILCLGLDQALVRYYYEKKNDEYRSSLLFKCIKLPVILSVIICFVFLTMVKTKIINFEFNFLVSILLCFYSIVQLIYRFSLLLVRLSYKSKIYSSLNIIHKLMYILVALPLILWISKDYLLMLIIATLASSFICMIISIIVQRKIWNFFNIDKEACIISPKELYKYGYPFIISMGLTTIFQAIDKISLNYYCSYAEVGIYSSTMTIVNIFAIIQSTFNALWAPMATEHYSNDKEDRSFYQKGNQIITLVMFFCGLSLILCKDVFSFLLGQKYREAAYILPFLIFHPIMYTISETTVIGISFKKKSKMQILVSAVACITNMIGNYYLVPILGGRGAAISTGISYIVFFTMRTIVSNKYFYIDFKLKKFYLLTSIVVLYAIYNTFISFNIVSIIGYIICITLLFILYQDTLTFCINYVIKYKDKIIKKIRNNK